MIFINKVRGITSDIFIIELRRGKKENIRIDPLHGLFNLDRKNN